MGFVRYTNYIKLHYALLHFTTLHYTVYTQLHYATLHDTQLRLQLHYMGTVQCTTLKPDCQRTEWGWNSDAVHSKNFVKVLPLG